MYIEYNPNPIVRKNAMDCPMRAVAKALDTDWESAFAMLCKNAFLMGDSPNSKVVVDSIMPSHRLISFINNYLVIGLFRLIINLANRLTFLG